MLKIAVVGEVNHGKTSFLENILGKTLLKSKKEIKDERTRNLQIQTFKTNNNTYYFIDSPGHSSYLVSTLLPIAFCDKIIFIFSSTQPNKTDKIISLLKYMRFCKKEVIICFSKIDLTTQELLEQKIRKVLDYLKIAKIQCSSFFLFSNKIVETKKDFLELLDRKTKEKEEKGEQTKGNIKNLVLRSFNLTKPGSFIENYQQGILGGLEIDKIEKGEKYYLSSNSSENIIIKIEDIIEDEYEGGYVTLKTNLTGCFCSWNRLRGSIISNTPLPIVEKMTIKIDQQIVLFKKLFLINGFTLYEIKNHEKKGDLLVVQGKFRVVGSIVCLIYEQEGIWKISGYGKVIN
jgi:small GTP-binding protein